MKRVISVGLVLGLVGLAGSVGAQAPASTPAAATVQAEIKLDETTTLRAAAVESKMAAILANVALLQRQLQDLQKEWATQLEARKKLVEDAAQKARVTVTDPNEWAFDQKGQRFVKVRKAP